MALVKQVPLGDHPGTLDSAGRLLRDGAGVELNPWCRRAVTRAVELGRGSGGRTTVVTMGPPAAADVLKEALACGADDGLLVSDPALAGADCLVTAKALAAAIRTLGPVDLVLVGRSTVDGGTGAVGPMVAALLGLPFTGPALTLEAAQDTDGLIATLQLDAATETVGLTLPAVLAVAERSCPPAKAAPDRWPDPAPIRTLGADRLAGSVPGTASPTRVDRVLRGGTARRPVILTGSPAEQAARAVDLVTARSTPREGRAAAPRVHAAAQGLAGPAVLAVTGSPGDGGRALLGEAAEIAGRLAGHVVAVTPPADPGLLGAWGADAMLHLGGADPRPAAAALAEWIRRCPSTPWAVLGGATPWDREVLARLAVHLDAGLLSDLTAAAIQLDGSGRPRLVGHKPAGGGTLAEVASDRLPQIATLRTGSLADRAARSLPRGEPPVELLDVGADPLLRGFDRRTVDDFDAVERAAAVIGLGAGVDPARYADVEPLRALLGAELAATRKVTDAGTLPHCRQVGVTGRGIAPLLYLAIGISGSPHHMVGVERAHTVLAVNSDPDAAVFGHCDIGIVADWQDVLPALTAAFGRAAARPETAAAATV
ncbi:FAD-binding protein [Streptomyces cocklensis]|uniref:FAD-binding protein n=1 Tax=Actinacidiphila cocklensis TaxID=887465 RepID=UPI00203DAFCF|nr:FAD-binding protein [Actinacidiphila cocklensis]MDD1062000.1 FAD-binding protein [Actinacidiphila cocklensis]